MSDEPVRDYFEEIRRRIAILKQKQDADTCEEIAVTLQSLQLLYEEMQAKLEEAQTTEEKLLLYHQQITISYHHYYDLFETSPVGYLVTDIYGVILEANQAIAHLLKVPPQYLRGKPLAVFIDPSDRSRFRTHLNQLSRDPEINGIQTWQFKVCGRKSGPFLAQLHVAIARNHSGVIESLRMGVYSIQSVQHTATELIPEKPHPATPAKTGPLISPLPQSLDGLQVLVVDDEADAREFITAVLESHQIRVKAVASAAEALAELEQFHPDVLVSDIRMPGEDGYSLIRQIRALEAKQGKHIPAAAITAYLDEDREKALKAGFEAHLHKLAQPSEFIKVVAQLAGRSLNQEHDSLE